MPRKTIPSHRAISNPHRPKATIFVPVRSHFWSEVDLDSFRKCYDVLLDYYSEPYEGQARLIEEVHIGWWCKFQRMFWKNEAFTLREVQDRYGIAPATFTSYVDRLEDVELLDREKCVDLRGQPVDLLIRTPYPPKLFLMERPRLQERVKKSFTATNRAKLGGAKSNGYPGRVLSMKDRLARIQAEQRDANLRKIQGIIDWVLYNNVGRNEPLSEKEFVEQVKRMCINEKVYYDDRLLRDAIGQYRSR